MRTPWKIAAAAGGRVAAAIEAVARTVLVLVACTAASLAAAHAVQSSADRGPLFSIADAQLGDRPVFVVYGDMRFTSPSETVASSPGARQALVARIAEEHPRALFLTGDIPWHGGHVEDYGVYREETAPWRRLGLNVYPVLGNHEFAECAETQCLENWWDAFPQLRGHRWYEVALGARIRLFALDSDTSLLPGSSQRAWLERELEALPGSVQYVLLALHHPPVADESWLIVRSNERSLAAYLAAAARRSKVRFIVCSAHVHNYERFDQEGVVYLVSGGGGAKPLAVHRSAADLYRHAGFPNYHYLRFELERDRLTVQMFRLTDYLAPSPHTWQVMDRFDIEARAAE